MTDTIQPITSAELADLKAKAKAAALRGCSVSEWYEFRRVAANPETILRLIDMIDGQRTALEKIAHGGAWASATVAADEFQSIAREALAATELK